MPLSTIFLFELENVPTLWYFFPETEEGWTTQWSIEKGHKDKQLSTKHYTENRRSSNTNSTKIRE
jgi:hypothetical protein